VRGDGTTMNTRSGGAPSPRQRRVAEQMRHLLAEYLTRGEVHDPRLEGRSLTVSEVRVSPDLRHATVYLSELGRPLSEEARRALQAAAGRLAGRLAREMRLKYAPRLRFLADERFEVADRIERLLREARARDGGRSALEDEER